jgi:hypothetical protein
MAETPARIEVRLRELAQLFNSMDPSPFHERDLDADAEEFIVSWAREHPAHRELELLVHLTLPPPADRGTNAGDAVRHYFAARAELKHREFRRLMRLGRYSLTVGLAFLVGCLALGALAGKIIDAHGYSTMADIIKESLTIGGWVAMWRPLEIYLYDWWPLRDEWRLLERLARMQVTLLLPAA